MLPGWGRDYEKDLAKLEELGEQEVRYRLSVGTLLLNRELVLEWLASLEERRRAESERREEVRADETLVQVKEANVIARDACNEARDANLVARDANLVAREANQIARKANRNAMIAIIIGTLSAIFSAWLSSRGGR